jgi:hypothetical protein
MSSPDLVCALAGALDPPGSTAGRGAGGEPRSRAKDAPALARLIAAASAAAPEGDGLGAALAPVYGVARQSDWPLAAIRAAALGVEVGGDYWLAADPVTLEAGRDDVRLAGAVADLAAGEVEALLATLNAHFRADGIAFTAPRPDAWFVRAPGAQALTTRPLERVLGRMLRDLLPVGRDAGTWRRWQSEIQMLLHEHPVNLERERAGRPPVNSVWFWGGGVRPTSPPRVVRTFARGGIAAALAAHAAQPAEPVPDSLAAALAAARAAQALVIVSDSAADLGAVERSWTAPAWSALARGAIASVTVIATGGGGAYVWTARRPAAWRRFAARWRSPGLAQALAAARAALESDG